jgi:hypothetical protein
MTITEGVQLGTFLIAILATAVSLKAFRRNKKQELENQLFKIKLEAFASIAFEIDNFFICLNRAIVKLRGLTADQEDHDELQKLSLDIDEQIYKCHSLIVKNSVYFSANSTQKLLEFTDNLLGDVSEDLANSSVAKWIDDYYAKQTTIANQAIDALRTDLHLESLHYSLYKRAG